MRLHVGCAMWTHKAWPGHSRPARERLRAYAEHCNAVEGNTTFYATPSPATVATWAEQTDPDFRFLLKLPKTVTHEGRLTGVETEMRTFLDAVAPLGPRLAALWVQLPPYFGPTDVDALIRFLRRLPAHRCAVEVRHPAFFTDLRETARLEDALTDLDVEWVPFDTTVLFATPPVTEDEQEAWDRKPRLPRRTRALTERPVVRYLGRDAVEPTVEGWRPWVEVVAGWLDEGRSPTVFVHTPDNVDAQMLARRFHEDVRALVPALPALPDPVPTEPATLF